MPRRLRSVLVLAALAALSSSKPPAEDEAPRYSVLPPSALRTDRIAAGDDSFTIVLVKDGRAQTVAALNVRTRFATLAGEPVIVRTELTTMPNEVEETDSFVMARADLAPRVVHGWGGSVQPDLRFAGGRVTGGVDTEGKHTDVSETVGGALYANEMDLVLRALPLAPGYAASVRLFGPVRGLEWANLRVVAAEEVQEAGARIPVWRVETQAGSQTGTFWVDRRTGAMVRWSTNGEDAEMRIVRVPRLAAAR